MANEIKQTSSLQCTNANLIMPKFGGTVNITQNAQGGPVPGMVVATNAAQGVNIPTTGLAVLGCFWLKNLDPAATIDWGPVVAGTLHVLGFMKPGEEATGRFKPGITVAVQSSAASSKVAVQILED